MTKASPAARSTGGRCSPDKLWRPWGWSWRTPLKCACPVGKRSWARWFRSHRRWRQARSRLWPACAAAAGAAEARMTAHHATPAKERDGFSHPAPGAESLPYGATVTRRRANFLASGASGMLSVTVSQSSWGVTVTPASEDAVSAPTL